MDLKFKDNSKLRLAPFTQLEYIECTGTQYIDTGISFPNGFRTVAKLYPTDVSSYKTFAGAFQANLHNIHRIKDGSWNPCTQTNANSVYGTVNVNTLYTVDMSNANAKYNLIVNGTTLANNVSTPAGYSSLTCWLFALHRTDNTDYHYYYGRIYEISLYDENNVLKFHGIPARDSNNVVCMYDTVSKQLFYNQGTGDFIAGPVVKSGIPETILLKTTTLYHKNTPNTNGLQLLNSILDYQKTHQDENELILLNRIRADIGNVEGPILDLLELAGMAGFNDNYEPQAKPRLVGTFTINNYYTSGQLTAAQAAFDGLTIIGDPNYLINFNDLAVQVLDPNEDNYNPAVAIILQGRNIGTTMTDAPSGYGRWFITKNDASLINVSKLFGGRVDMVDTNKIVSNDETLSYPFVSFNEFQYFTTVNNTAGYGTYNINFYNCTKLEQVTLPQTLTSIISVWNNTGGFTGCTSLKQIDLSNITYLYLCFVGCTELEDVTFGNITTIVGAFDGCSKLKLKELPTSLTRISGKAFQGVGSNLTLTDDDLIDVNLPNLTGNLGPAFHGCKLIKRVTNLGTITRLEKEMYYTGTFSNCPNLEFIELPSTLTTIDIYTFTTHIPIRTGLKDNCIIHLNSTTPPTFSHEIWPNTVKLYVGDGSSAAHDDAILQAYLADTNWATYSSRLDTWYNYLHPQS